MLEQQLQDRTPNLYILLDSEILPSSILVFLLLTPEDLCGHQMSFLLLQPLQVPMLYSQLAARPTPTHRGHCWGHLSVTSQGLIPDWETTLEGRVSAILDQIARCFLFLFCFVLFLHFVLLLFYEKLSKVYFEFG